MKIEICVQVFKFMFLCPCEPQLSRVHLSILAYIAKAYILSSSAPDERAFAAVPLCREPAQPSPEGGVLVCLVQRHAATGLPADVPTLLAQAAGLVSHVSSFLKHSRAAAACGVGRRGGDPRLPN